MKYEIIQDPQFIFDLKHHLKSGNTSLLSKIDTLLDEVETHPRTGTGKPERLKYYIQERWSRKIDAKHRLIYEIKESTLIIIAISAYGHYDNK